MPTHENKPRGGVPQHIIYENAMAYYDATNAIHFKQLNKGRDYATESYGERRNYDARNTGNKMEESHHVQPTRGYVKKCTTTKIMLAQMEI